MSREALEHWRRQMRSAQSEAALLSVVGAYLGTLSHEQLSRLPESSRPTAIARRDDIAALNVQIARDELMYIGDEEVAVLLRQMVVVLSEATKRLAQFSLDSQLPPRQGQ